MRPKAKTISRTRRYTTRRSTSAAASSPRVASSESTNPEYETSPRSSSTGTRSQPPRAIHEPAITRASSASNTGRDHRRRKDKINDKLRMSMNDDANNSNANLPVISVRDGMNNDETISNIGMANFNETNNEHSNIINAGDLASIHEENKITKKTSEIARLIPEFDGKNSTVKEFEKTVKAAEMFVSFNDKDYFFEIVKSKITGDAKMKLHYKNPINLSELFLILSKIYASQQDLAQIQVEMARVVQGSNENSYDYGFRVSKLLYLAIEHIETRFKDEVAKGMIEGTRKVALKCFSLGLKSDIANFLASLNLTDLEDAIDRASEFERDLNQRNKLRDERQETVETKKRVKCFAIKNAEANTPTTGVIKCFVCGKEGHVAKFCKERFSESNLNCGYCGKNGHVTKFCHEITRGNHNVAGIKCMKCGREGHNAKFCFVVTSNEVQRDVTRCYYCGELGHFARECRELTNKRKNQGNKEDGFGGKRGKLIESCNFCHRNGHSYDNCWTRARADADKENKKPVEKICNFCGRKGHLINNCKSKEKYDQKHGGVKNENKIEPLN